MIAFYFELQTNGIHKKKDNAGDAENAENTGEVDEQGGSDGGVPMEWNTQKHPNVLNNHSILLVFRQQKIKYHENHLSYHLLILPLMLPF